MIILGIFLTLTLIELSVINFYWSRVTDNIFVGVGTEVTRVTPMKYKRLPLRAVAFIKGYKKLLWIPAGVIMFANFVISLILGGVAMIIIGLIN